MLIEPKHQKIILLIFLAHFSPTNAKRKWLKPNSRQKQTHNPYKSDADLDKELELSLEHITEIPYQLIHSYRECNSPGDCYCLLPGDWQVPDEGEVLVEDLVLPAVPNDVNVA